MKRGAALGRWDAIVFPRNRNAQTFGSAPSYRGNTL
jgi:hypothetical protein